MILLASTRAEFDGQVMPDRIESGTYGICEKTGQPIPLERLEAVPWARFTLEAQREMEQQRRTPKAGLGPVDFMGENDAAAPERTK